MIQQARLALLAFAFLSAQAFAEEPSGDAPEWRLVIQLRGHAAQCSIEGRLIHIRTRKQGESADVEAAFKEARGCVDAVLPRGRGFYREALQAAPASKPVLAKAYASWMTYMDTLDVPAETEEQAVAKAAFESAVSEIRAELDSR